MRGSQRSSAARTSEATRPAVAPSAVENTSSWIAAAELGPHRPLAGGGPEDQPDALLDLALARRRGRSAPVASVRSGKAQPTPTKSSLMPGLLSSQLDLRALDGGGPGRLEVGGSRWP